MNLLAHLWLADQTQTSLAGAVLGDVIRGADLSPWAPALAEGLRLHRRVDALFDRHRAVLEEKARYPSGARRYAGVVIDMACDHALALDWARYAAEDLEGFCRRAAAAVAAEADSFTRAGARPPQPEAFARLLCSYREAAGIERALARIGLRLRRPDAAFHAAASVWADSCARLRPLLPALLSDLVAALRQPPPVAA